MQQMGQRGDANDLRKHRIVTHAWFFKYRHSTTRLFFSDPSLLSIIYASIWPFRMLASFVNTCVLAICLLYCVKGVNAQNLSIPPAWRVSLHEYAWAFTQNVTQNPTSELSRELRGDMAYEAAVPLSQMGDIAVGQPGL